MTKKPNKSSTKEMVASCVVAGEYQSVTPSKINLSNPEDIRREMARVYREARTMRLEPAEGAKLIYMLSQIAKAYELGVIEQRLLVLENANLPRRLQ